MARPKGPPEQSKKRASRKQPGDALADAVAAHQRAAVNEPEDWTLQPITQIPPIPPGSPKGVAASPPPGRVKPWWYYVLIAPLLIAGAVIGSGIIGWFGLTLLRVF